MHVRHSSGWEGDFCEADVDGCANFDCFMGVDCVDIPAPGVGAMCGPCPQGYLGDGSKCAGKLSPLRQFAICVCYLCLWELSLIIIGFIMRFS